MLAAVYSFPPLLPYLTYLVPLKVITYLGTGAAAKYVPLNI